MVVGWVGGEKGMIVYLCVGSEVFVMCFDGNFDWFVVLGIIYNVEWMLLWVLFD